MITISSQIILRKALKDNPNTLYLFGDNLVRKGFGGQAKEMRGEPNAIGIRTKKYPSNLPGSFLNDEDLDYNKKLITIDIDNALKVYKEGNYKNIVIPPLGIGMARLPQKAPLTHKFLLAEIERLTGIIFESDAKEDSKKSLTPVIIPPPTVIGLALPVWCRLPDNTLELEDYPSDNANFASEGDAHY